MSIENKFARTWRCVEYDRVRERKVLTVIMCGEGRSEMGLRKTFTLDPIF